MRISRSLTSDLFKYLGVAVIALIADSGSLAILVALHVQYLVAATVGFLIGTTVNFALSHGYVFHNPVIKNRAANFTVYAAIGVVSLIANDIIIWFVHSQLNMGLALAKLIAVAIVFFWNFLARRQFLYHGKDVDPSKEVSFES